MASAKETPRQKMIGMMYLVLTALLALNVSKDILNSFVIIDKSLEKTTETFAKKNDMLYADFDLTKSIDPKRALQKWENAQIVKIESQKLVSYIKDLKKMLIEKTDGLSKAEADTISLAYINSKDNYDIPTNIMIGQSEDGSKGLSRELKNKLIDYKTTLTGFLNAEDRDKIDLGITTNDPPRSDNNENWEMHYFYHIPLVAVITFLSKNENDVKNAESIVVDYLLKQLDVDALKFDTIAPKVIPQSNYVLLGEEYKADVFVAAFSKTQNPKILTGSFDPESNTFNGSVDTLDVERGMGKYSVKTTHESFVKWGGRINIKSPKGNILSYPFNAEYIVAKPALTVSAEKMNVFYMGVDNPVSISVPGVPNELIHPQISGGDIQALGNGKYIVKNARGSRATINVTAQMPSGENRNMGAIDFRVKPLPAPYARIDNITGKGKMKINLFKKLGGIIVEYDKNFDFQITCKVVSFDMSISSRAIVSQDETSRNNKFSDGMRKLIDQAAVGNTVFINNIKIIGPDNITRTLAGGLTVELIN